MQLRTCAANSVYKKGGSVVIVLSKTLIHQLSIPSSFVFLGCVVLLQSESIQGLAERRTVGR